MKFGWITAGLLLASPAPALAYEVPNPFPEAAYTVPAAAEREASVKPERSPWTAAALSVAVPVTAVGLTALYNNVTPRNEPLGLTSALTGVLSPFTFGLGHFYAGDGWRGTWTTLGGPVALVGGIVAGSAISYALALPMETCAPGGGPGTACGQGPGMTTVQVTAAVSMLAYGGWAAWDAYQTAERLNRHTLGPVVR